MNEKVINRHVGFFLRVVNKRLSRLILAASVAVFTSSAYAQIAMDDFEDASYATTYTVTAGGGSIGWLTAWDETGDDDDPSSGTIEVATQGASDVLRFNAFGNGDFIVRTFNALDFVNLQLTFELGTAGVIMEPSDLFEIQLSDDNGATWTQVDVIQGNDASGVPTDGTYSYDILTELGLTAGTATMGLRYGVIGSLVQNTEFFSVDNLSITGLLESNLSVVKTADLATVSPGEMLTYTLNVMNGSAVVPAVTVADALPPGVTFVSAAGAGFTCGLVAAQVICTIDPLPANADIDITVVVTVDP